MARSFGYRLHEAHPSHLSWLQYVCVFEEQKRGAWHAHLAVQRVQSHYLHKGAGEVIRPSEGCLAGCGGSG